MTRWARFAGVGLMGFALQLIIVHMLTAVLGVDYRIAIVAAVESAILHNFVWHERWTWRDRTTAGRDSVYARLVRFNTASGLISIFGNLLFTTIFVELAGAPVLVANIAAIACLTILNYLAADRLAFVAVTPGSRQTITVLGIAVLWGGLTTTEVWAAEPKSEVVKAWDQYVRMVEQQVREETTAGRGFLTVDRLSSGQGAKLDAALRSGNVVAESVSNEDADVEGATISHWRGYIFVPGATIDDLLEIAAVRGAAATYLPEDVLESRVLSRNGDSLRRFLKLRRTAIVTAAYSTDHAIHYARLASTRAISRSVATRIAELENEGTPQEREKSPDQDRGFMWRLNSYWRYQEVTGGVVVQLDSLTLSRDIPWAVRLMASPIVDRIARESMIRTLTAVREMHKRGLSPFMHR